MKKTQVYLFVITIFLNSLFYATITFLGGNYNEIIETNSWTIIKFVFFILVLVIFINDFSRDKIPLKVMISLYLVMLLIILTFSMQILSFDYINSLLFQDILIFGSRGIPIFLVGILITKRREIKRVVSYTQVVTIYTSLALVISFFSNDYRNGNITAFGGVNYQATAYTSALIFGLNLYYAFINEDKSNLLPIFRKNFMSIIHVFFSLLLLLNTFQSGGRGGAVVCVMYILLTFIYLFKKRKYSTIFLSILLISTTFVFIKFYLDDPVFLDGFNRAFSFLGGDSGLFDLKNGNRDVVFEKSVEYISKSLLYGYGLGSYYHIMGFYPHNLFLLIMFEGGIFLLTIYLIIMLVVIKILSNSIKLDDNNRIVLYIVICNFIQLMFSSTYLRDDLTWLLFGVTIGTFYCNSSNNIYYDVKLES